MRIFKAILLGCILTTACTKTEKVVELRQADPNVKESFTNSNKTTLTIKKSALQKTFLLVANSKTAGSQPVWQEHPIKIVSFELAGSRVGLFEVNYDQVYRSLNVQKVLQTFDIVSESDDNLVINIEKGFSIVGYSQGFEIMRPDEKQQALQKEGVEVGYQLIDALITKSEFVDNRLSIKQLSRFRVQTPESKSGEMSLDSVIEIIPYMADPDFKPKDQDQNWGIGSFLTRIFLSESDQTQALALRWNLKPGKVIRYILTGHIPGDVIPVLKEGLEYWNRVAGRQILTVEVSTQDDVAPMDGAVIVRWIPYKDAGFAYAGFQHNPMTSEILRGHIYLPSFWINPDYFDKKYDKLGFVPTARTGACGIDWASKEQLAALNEQAMGPGAKKAMYDYLRFVIAHEAGHTLGMRHDFAGSSVVRTSFSDIVKTQQTYIKDPFTARDYPELSVSVMDYTTALDSAIIGSRLLKQNLTYDSDYIAWAYNGVSAPASRPENYCTDDHLMFAGTAKIKILGCSAGESSGTPLMVALQEQADFDEKALRSDVEDLLDMMIGEDGEVASSIPPNATSMGKLYVRYNVGTYKAMGLFVKVADKKTFDEKNIYYSRVDATAAILDDRTTATKATTSRANIELGTEFATILRSPELMYLLLPVTLEGKLNTTWNEDVLSKINLETYKSGTTKSGVGYKMTDEQFSSFVANAKLVTRAVLTEKLVMAPLRLTLKRDLVSTFLGDYAQGIDPVYAYRTWIKTGTLQPLLKPYVEQLMVASFGKKSITAKNHQSVEVEDLIVGKDEIETIRVGLAESAVALGLKTENAAKLRQSEVRDVLQTQGLILDISKSYEEQVKDLDTMKAAGALSPDLYAWATQRLELAKYLLGITL